MPKNPHGIFCLETIWFDEVSNPSLHPLLELLKRLSGVPFAYRDISTKEEFDFCLGRWVGRNMYKKDYALGELGILYLGFHGSPGKIWLRSDLPQRSDDDGVSLNKITKSLTHSKNKFDCRGCAIHFGSCSVFSAPKRVKKFKNDVGAACVSGYRKSVDWTLACAFELMYLGLLSQLLSEKNVTAGTLGTLEKRIKGEPKSGIEGKPEYAGLASVLGFEMIY